MAMRSIRGLSRSFFEAMAVQGMPVAACSAPAWAQASAEIPTMPLLGKVVLVVALVAVVVRTLGSPTARR